MLSHFDCHCHFGDVDFVYYEFILVRYRYEVRYVRNMYWTSCVDIWKAQNIKDILTHTHTDTHQNELGNNKRERNEELIGCVFFVVGMFEWGTSVHFYSSIPYFYEKTKSIESLTIIFLFSILFPFQFFHFFFLSFLILASTSRGHAMPLESNTAHKI